MTHTFLTPEETASQLRTKITTLQWWRTMGKGPKYVKIGRRVFYRPADIDEFIAAGARSPAGA